MTSLPVPFFVDEGWSPSVRCVGQADDGSGADDTIRYKTGGHLKGSDLFFHGLIVGGFWSGLAARL